jgi:hypothetical protein
MRNNKELLNEDFIENMLMVIGFVPIIGEIADIILILRYIWQGKYLYAGLMLIALIPTVGDIIAKPFIYLLKSRKVTNVVLKNSDNLIQYLSKNPEAKKIYSRLGNHIDNPLIGKTINRIEKVPKIGKPAAEGMRDAIKEHASVLSKILNKPISIGKSIGKEIATNPGSLGKTILGRGPVGMGIKKHFRGERLAKYIEKNGKEPSTWLSYWWNIVYRGQKDRRAYVRNFIVANNLLNFFGIPSLSAFENKFENDEDFRDQLANDPRFSSLVGETTNETELSRINGMTSNESNSPGFFGTLFGLGFLKKIAQGLT